MKHLPLIALAALSGCVDSDIAQDFLVEGSTSSLSFMAGDARSFVCVVAIYDASSSSGPPKLDDNFEAWSAAPLEERVDEMAIEWRAMSSASKCWNEEIRDASGSPEPWHYIESVKPLIAFDHGGNVALFDQQERIFIAIAG